MSDLVIEAEDPRTPDIVALLTRHLDFCRATSPPEDVHALDLDGLVHPAVTFVAARRDGRLVGIGALKELDATHGELKSMHTPAEVRGQGVGAAVVAHLVELARARDYARVSLETGTQAAFGPAHRLYEVAGFEPCGPFAHYRPSPNSRFLTLAL